MIADLGHNVFLSGQADCEPAGGRFDRVLHIYRDDMGPGHRCNHWALPGPMNTSLCYRDGYSFVDEGIDLTALARDLGNSSERLLVHCAAGQTRSPTLAIVALMARGLAFRDAAGTVLWENWKQRGLPSNLCTAPLKDILQWAQGRGNS